jgi:predicted dehydrogenase
MTQPSSLRWGILGTGGIAKAFAADLKTLSGHTLAAVGSRTLSSAQAFAGLYGVSRVHGSYEALVSDSEVDVVYVATPHPMHCPNALLALNAGKSVLVEKPFAMSAEEASEMVSLARKKGLFLMEAMWTRFLPHIAEIRKILAKGALGKITTVQADHGQAMVPDPKGRMFAPELGGGALLDLGIYPVSFSSLVLGTPSKITAVADRAFTGVDAQTSILLQYASGAHAVLNTTLSAASPNRAAIVGTEGRIEIDRTFYAPTSFTIISREGKVVQRYENKYPEHGLREEAEEVLRCLKSGLKESPLLPLDETVSIMKIIDEVRRQTLGAD